MFFMSLVCVGVGFVVLVGVIAVAVVMMIAADRDTVSTARQGWIQRRSKKDEQGW